MTNFYDTVIIGGGPAGMSCAIALQKSHKQPCVIEKAVFPRHKTCAGLVTKKTYQLIKTVFDGDDIDALFCCTASGVKLYRKTQLLVDAQVSDPLRLVNRIDYDNALVMKYLSLGGVMLQGEKNYTVDEENREIHLSNGDVIRFHTLIYADGALSDGTKRLKIDKSLLAFGIEASIPSSQLKIDSVNLYFDVISGGYLWAFPHGETVCVGAANPYQKHFDYKRLLSGFLEELGVDTTFVRYVGAFLPYGYIVPQEKLPDHVMLIGDAGGFADPISGEGLCFSLKTGMLAAESLSYDRPKKQFLQSVEPIYRTIREGLKLQKSFYSSKIHRMFLNRVKGKEKFVTFFFDHQVSDYGYDYRDMLRLYLDYKNVKDNN